MRRRIAGQKIARRLFKADGQIVRQVKRDLLSNLPAEIDQHSFRASPAQPDADGEGTIRIERKFGGRSTLGRILRRREVTSPSSLSRRNMLVMPGPLRPVRCPSSSLVNGP